MKKNKNNCHSHKAHTIKVQKVKKKDRDKGNLDTGIIALLHSTLPLINSLLLRSNFLLIKKDIVLHILERIKETKVKVLGKETSLPDSLLKPFFMLLHDLLLVNEQLLLKLFTGLSL